MNIESSSIVNILDDFQKSPERFIKEEIIECIEFSIAKKRELNEYNDLFSYVEMLANFRKFISEIELKILESKLEVTDNIREINRLFNTNSLLNKEKVTFKDIADELGVDPRTLVNWKNNSSIIVTQDTERGINYLTNENYRRFTTTPLYLRYKEKELKRILGRR